MCSACLAECGLALVRLWQGQGLGQQHAHVTARRHGRAHIPAATHIVRQPNGPACFRSPTTGWLLDGGLELGSC